MDSIFIDIWLSFYFDIQIDIVELSVKIYGNFNFIFD